MVCVAIGAIVIWVSICSVLLMGLLKCFSPWFAVVEALKTTLGRRPYIDNCNIFFIS